MTQPPDKTDLERLIGQYVQGQLPPRRAIRLEESIRRDGRLVEQLKNHRSHEQDESSLHAGGQEGDSFGPDAIMESLERKVLLGSKRPGHVSKKRLLLGISAAAVFLLAVAGIVNIVLGPDASAPPEPVIAASMLPAAETPQESMFRVEYPPAEAALLRLTEADVSLTSALPAGTIIVSIEVADGAVSADWPAYPVNPQGASRRIQ